MSHEHRTDAVDALDEDELTAVYGDEAEAEGRAQGSKKRDFQPWHHPVKQFVRREQWIVQASRLFNGRGDAANVRYLTLPGEDMMDVRLLGETFKQSGRMLECLGFNSRAANEDSGGAGGQINAESALRQERLITDSSITLTDRLQDIAVPSSQADNQLKQWRPFDIINIDLCGHFAADAGSPSALEAMDRLVQHQRIADRPWLLMLTTRVHPEHLGAPKDAFDDAIRRNIQLGGDFPQALADALDLDLANLSQSLNDLWGEHDEKFVKLYTIGLGKYLLHLLHNQYQDPARVELKSCLAYRVYEEEPDMLSVAFLISPEEKRLVPANAGPLLPIAPLEVAHALRLARKAARLVDVDEVLRDTEKLESCLAESEALLESCNYDIREYRDWVSNHAQRRQLLEDRQAEA